MALGGLGPPRPQGSGSAMPACHLRRQGTRLTSTVVTLTDVQSRPSSRYLSGWRSVPASSVLILVVVAIITGLVLFAQHRTPYHTSSRVTPGPLTTQPQAPPTPRD